MKKSYIKPVVETAEVKIEKGFATSLGNGFDPNDFGSGFDDWWTPDEIY